MIKKILTICLFIVSLNASECDTKVFGSLSAAKGTTIEQMIDRLSDFCSFSVTVKDADAETALNKKLSNTNLKNFTLKDAFEYLLTENGFSYTFNNNLLTIRYTVTKTFKIDYIATARKGQSNMLLAGQSANTQNMQTSSGTQTSSQAIASSTLQTTDDFRFWSQIEQEVKLIIAGDGQRQYSQPVAKQTLGEKEITAITPGQDMGAILAQYGQAQNFSPTQNVIVNKEAGLITVTANQEKLKEVQAYLDTVINRLHRQVFIDVHIYQVILSNGSNTGIDWTQIMKAGGTSNYNVQTPGAPNALTNFIQFTGSLSITQLLGFLNTQGNVRSISNPKVMTLNNQPAIIVSGKIIYYPNVSGGTSGTATTGATNPNVTSTPLQVGVTLDITPEILDDNEVMLKINPSIATCEQKDCPLQQINVAGQTYSIAPNLAQQQLASLVKVNDGDKVVLGGLIQKQSGTDFAGMPGLSSIPLLGRIFSQNITDDRSSELVIVITPYVIKKSKTPSLKELGYTQTLNKETTNDAK